MMSSIAEADIRFFVLFSVQIYVIGFIVHRRVCCNRRAANSRMQHAK